MAWYTEHHVRYHGRSLRVTTRNGGVNEVELQKGRPLDLTYNSRDWRGIQQYMSRDERMVREYCEQMEAYRREVDEIELAACACPTSQGWTMDSLVQ